MSFLAPSTDVPTDFSSSDQEQSSSYQEAKSLANCRGNGRLGLDWVCENTEPRLTQTGKTHFHYHADIAGLLNHGIIEWLGEVEVNGEIITNLNYTWNGSENYHDFIIDTDGGHTSVPTYLRVYFGTETQTADSYLNGFHAGQSHPGYRGQSLCVLRGLYGGEGSYRVPNVTIQFRTLCEFTHDATTYGDTAYSTGVNPVNYLHHVVTHPRAGLGLDQDSIFDMDDMVAKYIRFNTENNDAYGEAQRGYVSPQMTKDRKAKDWIKELLQYIDGFSYYRNGKIGIDWFPHEIITELAPSQFTTISQADHSEKADINFPVWENTTTGVAINYKNIEKRSRKASLVARSLAAATILGEERIEPITRDWYFYTKQAQSYADRYLGAVIPYFSGQSSIKRDLCVMPDNVSVDVSRRGTPFQVGDVFNYNYAPYQIDLLARITEIKPRGKSWVLSWVQERGTAPVEYELVPDLVPDLSQPTPDDIATWFPYCLPVGVSGDNKNRVTIFAERYTRAITSWDVTFNDNDTWTGETAYLEEQVSFAARHTLNENVADEAGPTTFEIEFDSDSVDVTDLMQSLDAKQSEDNTLLLLMGDEIMSIETVSLISGSRYDVTCLRGRMGTDTKAHATSLWGYVIFREDLILWEHEKFDQVYDGNGDYDALAATKYFKMRTRNFYQEGSWTASQSEQLADQNPSTPTGLTAAAQTEGVSFTFNAVEGDGRILYYEIENADNAGFVGSSIVKSGATRVLISGVSGGTTIYGRVRAIESSGLRSGWSSTQSETAIAPAVGAPGNDGSDGLKTASGIVYYTIAQASTPGTPSATSINFATGVFSGLTANWQTSPVEVVLSDTTIKYWVCQYSVAEDTPGGSQTFTWGSPVSSINFGDDIQSDNFVSGTSGWRLERDTGDLEANDGTFRGSLEVSDGDTTTEIKPGTVQFGSNDLRSGFPYDPLCRYYMDITSGASSTNVTHYTTAYSPDDSKNGRVQILANATNSLGKSSIIMSGGGGTVYSLSTDGNFVSGRPFYVTDGFSYGTVQASIVPDANGGRIEINDDGGDERIHLDVNSSDRGEIRLFNELENHQVVLYSTNDGGRIDLYDEAENFRAYFRVRDGDGNTELVLRDSAGNSDVYLRTGDYNVLYVAGGELTHYTINDTDITDIVPGSTFGSLWQGQASGHAVVGVRGNESTDGFFVIKDETSFTGIGSYDLLLLGVNNNRGVWTEDLPIGVYDSGDDVNIEMDKDANGGRLIVYNTEEAIRVVVDVDGADGNNGVIDVYNASHAITTTISGDSGIWTKRLRFEEQGSAPTGISNEGIVFSEDNGSGKTRLMVQFGSGAAQQLAIEP